MLTRLLGRDHWRACILMFLTSPSAWIWHEYIIRMQFTIHMSYIYNVVMNVVMSARICIVNLLVVTPHMN
jgi:hypothetical protein